MGRPPRDREAEQDSALAALEASTERHKVRKLDGPEADLLHRTFSSAPEAYDAWEFETH